MLTHERQKLYDDLEKKIGQTPIEKYTGFVPNGNTIYIKKECDNPFGSHYDRVYFELFKHFEEELGLTPEMNVLETSSGSAAVSFAGIGKLLGYNCYTMIPEDKVYEKRREAIKKVGGKMILTPAGEGINGFTKERIIENIKKYDAKFLNHSMGPKNTNNEVTLKALEGIAYEVLTQTPIDVYVSGLGNGSSVIGPGRIFRKANPETLIVGYKPAKIGISDAPGLINQDGMDKEKVIPFPHIREAEKMMNETYLFSSKKENKGLVHWDDESLFGISELGVSSKAGIGVALKIAEKLCGKNILCIAYDKAERY